MTRKKPVQPLHWVRLDNAAKIYPAARSRHWSTVFRQSVTLTEPVDVPVLQGALEVCVARFPSIAARLRKGAFWYYLQQVDKAPPIREEYSCPLAYMSKQEMRRCAFRVIVHERRIAVEFFHSLTDGTGALIFLKNLAAEYLERKYGISVPAGDGIVDRREEPRPEELEDSFLRYAGKVTAQRRDTDAWRLSGTPEPDGFLNLTCFRLPVDETLALAHRYGVTVTVFLSAVMMQALLELQAEQQPDRARRRRVKLLIPVNLRQLFPSRTLRNFAMFTIPELDPRTGDYRFEEICDVIRHRLGLENTARHMGTVLSANVRDERNPLVRLIPLPVKNMVMKAVFNSVGERKACLNLSNLGAVRVPEVMGGYIERFDFILGVQSTGPYNCGVISWGNTVNVNFIRGIRQPGLELHFYQVLQRMGLPVTVESNRNGR